MELHQISDLRWAWHMVYQRPKRLPLLV